MSEYDTLVTMVREILEVWRTRNERQAVKQAGGLKFWTDGMLQQLRAIATGKATEETFQDLQAKFRATASGVAATLDRLTQLRNELGGNRLADHIDAVIGAESIGKISIRKDIQQILNLHATNPNSPAITFHAKQVCENIEVFNDGIGRLYRKVHNE